MTQLMMLTSRNTINHNQKKIVIVFLNFPLNRIDNKVGPRTIQNKSQYSVLLNLDRYINSCFWSNALNMHILVFSGSRYVEIGILFSDSRHFRV